MYDLLRSINQNLEEQMIDFAKRLVQVPSSSLQESKVAELVEEEMKKLGYDEVIRDEAGNVVGILHGFEPEQTMLLNSHMDTVKVEDPKAWKGDPFRGTIEQGWLQGVGTADCKAGLAAQVYSGALLKNSYLPLKDNLIVAATVAEENGASIGVRHLIDETLAKMEMKPDWTILGEPTGLGLYYAHDGWMEMEIKAGGGSVFQADDANQALIKEFENYSKQLNKDYGQEIQRVYHMADKTVGDANQTSIHMLRRLGHSENSKTILAENEHMAESVLRSMNNVAVAVKLKKEKQQLYNGTTTIVKRIAHAWEVDPFCPLITRARQSLEAAHCQAKPGKWALKQLGMGTAGGVLVNDYAIPTIGYGPGEESQAHAVDEAVEVKKITQACLGTAVIAYSMIGVPVFGWTSDEI